MLIFAPGIYFDLCVSTIYSLADISLNSPYIQQKTVPNWISIRCILNNAHNLICRLIAIQELCKCISHVHPYSIFINTFTPTHQSQFFTNGKKENGGGGDKPAETPKLVHTFPSCVQRALGTQVIFVPWVITYGQADLFVVARLPFSTPEPARTLAPVQTLTRYYSSWQRLLTNCSRVVLFAVAWISSPTSLKTRRISSLRAVQYVCVAVINSGNIWLWTTSGESGAIIGCVVTGLTELEIRTRVML